MDAATWKDIAAGVASVAQAIAIVGAAIWGYFKFLRGRTFAHRAEVSVIPTVVALEDDTVGLKVSGCLRNVGLSKIPLRTQAIFLYGIFAAPTDDDPVRVGEEQFGKPRKIFAAHKWLEAQETVTDEIFLFLGDRAALSQWRAFRVECRVYERRRKPGALKWTASAVVSTADAVSPDDAATRTATAILTALQEGG